MADCRSREYGETSVYEDVSPLFVCDILTDGLSRYDDFAKNKDVQMLAMLAVLMLQTPYTATIPPSPRAVSQRPLINVLPSSIRSQKPGVLDVFTVTQGLNQQPNSPAVGQQPSPIVPALAPSLSSSSSSRGSWTNIFSTGRQFVQDALNSASAVPTDLPLQSDVHSKNFGFDKSRHPDSPSLPGTGPRRRKDSRLALAPAIVQSTANTSSSRSWADDKPHLHRNRTSSGAGGGGSNPNSGISTELPVKTKRPPRGTGFGKSTVPGERAADKKQFVVFHPPEDLPRLVVSVFLTLTCFMTWTRSTPVFSDDFVNQLIMHVHIYAELLFRWHMLEKRIQLLKTVNRRNYVQETNKGIHHQVGEHHLYRILIESELRARRHHPNMCTLRYTSSRQES